MKTMSVGILLSLASALACQTPGEHAETQPTATGAPDAIDAIDQRSYQLGVIGAFAEVVGVGVKRLALSSALSPADMEGLIDEAEKIVARNEAESYLETDFLVTDLFPVEVTEGKHVLLIYLDPVKDEYMALKARKQKLIEDNAYEGEARAEIAREMGRLLSYPEERIEGMLSK